MVLYETEVYVFHSVFSKIKWGGVLRSLLYRFPQITLSRVISTLLMEVPSEYWSISLSKALLRGS